jgi:hypothetical protein
MVGFGVDHQLPGGWAMAISGLAGISIGSRHPAWLDQS